MYHFKTARLLVITTVGLATMVAAVAQWKFGWMGSTWEWFATSNTVAQEFADVSVTTTTDSGATVARNLGLLVFAAVALGFAWWRANIADRQAEAAHANAETAQETLLNDQYQRATESLGATNLAVRLGTIYQLRRISRNNPHRYHLDVVQQLCAFIRFPTNDPHFGNGAPSSKNLSTISEIG